MSGTAEKIDRDGWARAHFGLQIAHVALSIWGLVYTLLLAASLFSVRLESPAAVLGLYAALGVSWLGLAAWSIGWITYGFGAPGPASRWTAHGAAAGAGVFLVTSVGPWEPYSLATSCLLTLVAAEALGRRVGRPHLRRDARRTLGALAALALLVAAARLPDDGWPRALALLVQGVAALVGGAAWLSLVRVVRGMRVVAGRLAGSPERFG